jgi:hypothetical protein
MTYKRHKWGRFWAVYEGDELLCVTVYLKGALAVIERITGVRPPRPRRKRKTLPPPIPPRHPNFRELTLSHILDASVSGQDEHIDPAEALAHIEALAREGLRLSLESTPQR